MAAFISQVNTFLSGVSKASSDVGSLKSSYNTLRSGLSSATLGLVKLPSMNKELNKILKLGQHADNILAILGLTSNGVAGVANNTQTSNTNVNSGSFKWVEMETTPDSFATADSVLIFAGDPLYSNMEAGAELVPIGMCQGFNFSTSLNVIPFKELRCEENMIIPGKSQPGNLQLSRLCGAYSSLTNRLHILPGWNYGTQSKEFKPLFGIMVMFLTPSRQDSISTLYFERCAISSVSMGTSAGSFQLVDNVNIMFGRCVTVGQLTTAESVSTATTAPTTGDKDNAWSVAIDGVRVTEDAITTTRSELPEQYKETGLITASSISTTNK